jgi:enamine deaminase RidA (YjgF/YER057c/UK114 family)
VFGDVNAVGGHCSEVDRPFLPVSDFDNSITHARRVVARCEPGVIAMKILMTVFVVALVTLVAASGSALAQSPAGAEARLKEKNITLPPPPPAVGNYVSAVQVGRLLFLSSISSREFTPKGKVGKDLTVEQGNQAARHAGLLMLASVRAHLGNLDRVKRVVKVIGMVNSADGFGEQPKVINGFSDLLVEVFGETIGKHARTAVGMAALPGNAPVVVDIILEVE